MDNDIKTILQKLTGLETNANDIRGTLLNVEQKVHGVEQKVDQLEQKLHEFEQKVDQNFKDTSESIAGVLAMVSQRFDEVDARLDHMEKSHGYRLETLERDVAVLNA